MGLSTKEIILLGLIPMGQLWARIFKYNGSLDHKWALMPFFMLPPLSFIPILMMKFGMFKKGKGGKPYDIYMLIPILARIFISMFAENYDFPMWVIIEITLNLLTIGIPYFIRTYKLCNGFNGNNLLNTFGQTAITQASVNIFTFAIGFVPYVGMMFTLIEMIPVVGPLLPWSIGYVTTYVVVNMINGDSSKLLCSDNKKIILPFLIGSLVATTILKSLDLA
tara:strand:+ start:80 stop:745 length:666 start_codon:yes stop_codon:yes gene_type:complete